MSLSYRSSISCSISYISRSTQPVSWLNSLLLESHTWCTWSDIVSLNHSRNIISQSKERFHWLIHLLAWVECMHAQAMYIWGWVTLVLVYVSLHIWEPLLLIIQESPKIVLILAQFWYFAIIHHIYTKLVLMQNASHLSSWKGSIRFWCRVIWV